MKYTCPIFMDVKHVRDGTANIYRGGDIFSHVTGFPHVAHEAAERIGARCENPVIYRINVRMRADVSRTLP